MDEFLVHDSGRSQTPSTHALVIGAGTYPHLLGGAAKQRAIDHEGMGQLTSPPVSARRVAGWMIDHLNYPPKPLASVSLLLSGEKTRASFTNPKTGANHPVAVADSGNVVRAVKQWKARGDADSENRLLFYFCGHGIAGGPDMALLLRDYGADPDNSLDGALDFSKLYVSMDRCRAREQVFFIDACRVTSATLDAARSYAGQVPVQPGERDRGLGARLAPAYYSTLAGEDAYGRPDGLSPFTEALLEGFKGAGSDRRQGDWRVNTTMLHMSIEYSMHQAVEDGAVQVQVPVTGNLSTFTLHHLSGQPSVPVRVFCRPDEAHRLALLRCTPRGAVAIERQPDKTVWKLPLVAGDYRFAAEFADGSYASKVTDDIWVSPPYWHVPLDVTV